MPILSGIQTVVYTDEAIAEVEHFECVLPPKVFLSPIFYHFLIFMSLLIFSILVFIAV